MVCLFVCLFDAETKIAYCITCEMSVGNALQAAAHYRSREHMNRRLQRGLPVTVTHDQTQAPASRDFINECLRRGIALQQPGITYCYLHFWLLSVCCNFPDLSQEANSLELLDCVCFRPDSVYGAQLAACNQCKSRELISVIYVSNYIIILVQTRIHSRGMWK